MMPEDETDHEAILVVFSEPGEAVELKEFNEWYDEEHVPLRMRFPEFQTGARYEAIDGQNPSFAAIYRVSSLGLFRQPRYQGLRTNRSAREAELFSRIGTIDRRTYRCTQVAQRPSSDHHHPYHSHLLTVELAEPSCPLILEMESLDGWRSTQAGEIIDSSVVGRLQPSYTDPSRTLRFMVIFEFTNRDYEKSVQLTKLAKAADANQSMIREWELHRGWKNSCNYIPVPAD
ncbi:hypothetical protein PtA15_5A556 [Puccinia triticina]|uniref:EthD domain-containing protein n=1 Tax=Puccinia triticina TaxID=208348 RepID=A0ABY7CIE2_9BASI|nr:uncharacterized protein PtA15_5A556 [Puccinia triticina]WAQ84983.1 hypothetical protein PtA15_5A556 [Puccinia triticina]